MEDYIFKGLDDPVTKYIRTLEGRVDKYKKEIELKNTKIRILNDLLKIHGLISESYDGCN